MLPLNTVSPPAMNMNGDNRWSSPFDVGYPTPVGSAAFITHAYQDTGTASAAKVDDIVRRGTKSA
ncbi:unnamed protein product [Alternaria alternata]